MIGRGIKRKLLIIGILVTFMMMISNNSYGDAVVEGELQEEFPTIDIDHSYAYSGDGDAKLEINDCYPEYFPNRNNFDCFFGGGNNAWARVELMNVNVQNKISYHLVTIGGRGTIESLPLPRSVIWKEHGDFKLNHISTKLKGIENDYNDLDNEGNIVGWKRIISNVIIKDGIENIPERMAFNLDHLETVTIPNSVKNIGKSAFYDCDNLTNITIPEGVTNIEEHAFADSGLTNISIPGGINRIGNGAFFDCDNLREVTIEKGVTTIGKVAFSNCDNLKHVVIEEGVTTIGERAFRNCTNLESITIPSSVTKIESGAFEGCTNLKNITISSQTHSMEAFKNLNISKVTITPAGDKTIKASLLKGNTGIEEVEIAEGIIGINSVAFDGCSNLTSIEIPNSVTKLGSGIFNGCDKLSDITIPSSVVEIQEDTFLGSNFTNINVDLNNPNYADDDGVLFNKNKTALIMYPSNKEAQCYEVPTGVITIDKFAFNYCSKLKDVKISNTVVNIEEYAFDSCTSLETIKISNSVTKLESYTVIGCPNLKSIIIPSSVEEIAINAIDGGKYYLNSNLTVYCSEASAAETWAKERGLKYKNIEFEEDVIGIDDVSKTGDNSVIAKIYNDGIAIISGNGEIKSNAISNRLGIEVIKIGESISSIESDAFAECYNLERIDVDENNANYCSVDGVLYSKDKTILVKYPLRREGTSYTVLDTTKKIEFDAFGLNYDLIEITIPSSVTNIESGAFNRSYNLNAINVEESNLNFMSEDGVLYDKNKTTLIRYPEGKNGENYAIPLTIEKIDENAFFYCRLTNIEVDKNNENYLVENGVLYNKDKTILIKYSSEKEDEYYEIPAGVTDIAKSAFYSSTNLENIILPEGLKKIGSYAFCLCSSMDTINIPDSIETIEDNAFVACFGMDSIKIPDGITTIKENTFNSCIYLTSIEIPNTVTSIEDGAFSSCVTLKNVIIPESVEVIGENIFYHVGGLVYCKKDSIVENYLKQNKKNYKTYEAYEDVSKESNNSINAIILDDGVMQFVGSGEVKKDAFFESGNAELIKTLSISEGITNISGINMKNMSNLEEIEVEGENYNIIEEVLYNEDGSILIKLPQKSTYTTFEVPSNVTTIDGYAFYGCESMTNTYIPKSVNSIGVDVFGECSNDLVISGDNNSEAKKYAGENNIQFMDVEIPELKVRYSTKEETTGNVTVTLTSDEEIQEVGGWSLSEDKKVLTKVFSENVTETILVNDLSENESIVTIEITNIIDNVGENNGDNAGENDGDNAGENNGDNAGENDGDNAGENDGDNVGNNNGNDIEKDTDNGYKENSKINSVLPKTGTGRVMFGAALIGIVLSGVFYIKYKRAY